MSSIVNVLKTLRNHWKKSIFFSGLGLYGLKYANNKYEEDLLRRQYCKEAKTYGDQPIKDLGEKTRKVTVFLNSAAGGGRARRLFEKNAAPLLYLAGLDVKVVKTEYDGQIKEFIKVLGKNDVDALVVAGGNGSLVELVTGTMRKEDTGFRQKVALGVIPLGESNRFASYFFGPDKDTIRQMLDSAMAIVKGVTKKLDVLQIQDVDGRSTYALCSLEAGAYRDAKENTSKYWYFGPLKHRFTYIRSVLGHWPRTVKGKLEYVEAKGTDIPIKKLEKKEEISKQSQSWISFIVHMFVKPRPLKKNQEEEEEDIEYEETEVIQRDVDSVEVTMFSNFDNQKQMPKAVTLELGPSNITRSAFITEGWRRLKTSIWTVGSNDNEKILCRRIKFTPDLDETSKRFYSIDGEPFEVMPVDVKLLKNKLKIYHLSDSDLSNFKSNGS